MFDKLRNSSIFKTVKNIIYTFKTNLLLENMKSLQNPTFDKNHKREHKKARIKYTSYSNNLKFPSKVKRNA